MTLGLAANQVAASLAVPEPGADVGAARASFERSLVRDYPGMTLLLLRQTRDPQLAADILQDAIVTTLAKLDAGAAKPTPAIAGYVFRTALNHLRNHRRRERLRAADPQAIDTLPTEVASPVEHSQREANARAVRRMLQGLGSLRDREILVRFYLHEQSKEEICAALNLGAHDFDRVISRARERLRRQFENQGLDRADLLGLVTIVTMLGPGGL